MHKYTTAYKWMIVPMIIMQLGIFMDYWGDFSENAWSVHIHYWTGTVWYIYLIIQPYYATHGQLNKHRTNGIIGMFVAGGVCLTALSMMHRDIVASQAALENPERFDPFQPWFFFGIASIEIVMIISFGFAIIQSIIHRKELENHAWWLISTVFIIMMPALARGIGFICFSLLGFEWVKSNFNFQIYATEFLIIAMIIIWAWKYEKLKHPATYLAILVNVLNVFVEPIGKSESIQVFLKTLIKG